jgi:hypothetical protein
VDDRSFDTLVRSLASGANRRQILKGLLGLGGAAVASASVLDAEAARRPTPTPKPKRCPGVQVPCDEGCCCPDGFDTCGSDCCPADAQCCDNACCYGYCYGEELCCPSTQEWCDITGECCPEGWSCCPEVGCLPPGQCCTAAECTAELCTRVDCTAEHVCSEPVADCTNGGVEQCCLEDQVCLDNGSCCTPSCSGCGGGDGCGGTCGCLPGQVCLDNGLCCTPMCDGVACGASDGCGGTCACPEGYGCGDDGECHVCSACYPVVETCGGNTSCATFCTSDGVVCLSIITLGQCSSQAECRDGEYCVEGCFGLKHCLLPCGSSAARIAATDSQGIDVFDISHRL